MPQPGPQSTLYKYQFFCIIKIVTTNYHITLNEVKIDVQFKIKILATSIRNPFTQTSHQPPTNTLSFHHCHLLLLLLLLLLLVPFPFAVALRRHCHRCHLQLVRKLQPTSPNQGQSTPTPPIVWFMYSSLKYVDLLFENLLILLMANMNNCFVIG